MIPRPANNFVIVVATINGSGSQTANSVFVKSLFRQGVPVGAKNVFPSNIAGLPTWFWIRANEKGYLGAAEKADVVVALNPQTLQQDQDLLEAGGYLLVPETLALGNVHWRTDIAIIKWPHEKLMAQITAPFKIKKLASTMIFVGLLTRLFQLDSSIVKTVLQDYLKNRESALVPNMQAFELGWNYAQNELRDHRWPFSIAIQESPEDKILIDGNSAAAMGLVSGGCRFVSWYPITPSTSIVDAFSKFSEKTLKTDEGKNKFVVVQAEDELAAFSMVLGAGWAGTRAMTATSGPGLSLMAEAAGYAYYAEIPAVIWDVQRAGPSTGLPTRTAQGDVQFAATLSHGDTKHILLFPSSVSECFEFGRTCFDLAEKFQTLVIVLSDLDLGMNLWMSPAFKATSKPIERGCVLTEGELEFFKPFRRYQELQGDGLCARTLIGNKASGAAYFTRGSGHNANGKYTEKSVEYAQNIERLSRKWETAKKFVPAAEITGHAESIGLIYYGSTAAVIDELRALIESCFDNCRIRAFPFGEDIEKFISAHKKLFVIEQNRDGQLKNLLVQEFPKLALRLESICHFNGTPITAAGLERELKKRMI